METWRLGDLEKRRKGEKEKRRKGDAGTLNSLTKARSHNKASYNPETGYNYFTPMPFAGRFYFRR
jgi:hypothetical protein